VTYNQERFLGELLESVFAQDYPAMDVFVADDASTDNTEKVCRNYSEKYPGRFAYQIAKRNGGITANSNVALEGCKGDFICVVGGDDVFLPGKVRAQVEWLRARPNAALCACGVEVFDSATGKTINLVRDKVLLASGGVGSMIRQSCATPTSAFMFRRDRIRDVKFESRILVASDWLFIIEACMRGEYGCVDRVLLRYRRHVGNVTAYGEAKSHIEDRLIYTDIFFARYRSHFFSLKIQRAQILHDHGKRAGYEGRQSRALKFMLYALAEWPLKPAAWVGLALSVLSWSGKNFWRSGRQLMHNLRGIDDSSLPTH
jgi:glycosyltransferase involved in cell wall biosynthesis